MKEAQRNQTCLRKAQSDSRAYLYGLTAKGCQDKKAVIDVRALQKNVFKRD